MHDNTPLKDVVLCSTSLTQDVRTVLANVASDMGAIHRLDLTTDVTHLIVGNIDTPKYKHVAKERPDIHVLKPQWIDAIRQAWTEGGDVDVDRLVEQFRLPTFSDLQICVTGFEDLNQRQELQTTINDNGATYHGDLTRVVTHLIAARPQGPKYDRAKTWGLKIVSLKWFQESVERGMILEESLYEPRIPKEEQGQGAFIRGYQKQTQKRQRSDGAASVAEDFGKRKMRRTASTRLSTHSQSLWADMSAFEEQHTAQQQDQWNNTSETLRHGELDAAPDTVLQGPNAPSINGPDLSRPVSRATSLPKEDQGLFSNVLCLVRGHDSRISKKIIQVLVENGCTIAESPDSIWATGNSETQTVMIVPSTWTSENKHQIPDLPSETWRVTEWWIERCIERKTILDPSDDPLSRAHLKLSKNCLQGTIISTTGMNNRILHLSKLAAIAGATYMEKFSPKCSVLLLPGLANANQTKIDYAAKHNIPVVSEDWLYQSIDMGRKMPVAEFLLSPTDDRVPRDDQALDLSDSMLRESIRRKDDHTAQRLSATRKRSVTPSLPLAKPRLIKPGSSLKFETTSKATAMSGFTTKAPVPFLEDEASTDDDEAPMPTLQLRFDGSLSQPLQELPPHLNSPPKRSQELAVRNAETTPESPAESHVEETLTTIEQNGGPVDENALSAQEIDANKARLDDDIKSLYARQKAASALVESENPRRRRKDRKLGRALSNMSNTSAPGLRHNPSLEIADSIDTASPIDIPAMEMAPPMPSQQIGYENIDAQEHRARMSKKMGTNLTGDTFGVKVESIGVVRDTDSSGHGVGGRVRGRHRSSKN